LLHECSSDRFVYTQIFDICHTLHRVTEDLHFQFCPAFADEIFTSLSVRFTLDYPVIKLLLLSLQHQCCRPVYQHYPYRPEAGKSHFISILLGFLYLSDACSI